MRGDARWRRPTKARGLRESVFALALLKLRRTHFALTFAWLRHP